MDKYKGLYRIPSSRLPHWDYSSDATYFVTICTKDKVEYFGKVVDGIVQLSVIGNIVKEELLKTERMRKNIRFDQWVILPNHIHVIIDFLHTRTVETQCIASLQSTSNNFGPQRDNLPSVIRGFKTGVKVSSIKQGLNFHWQPRYYDHVIRDEKSMQNIREYIVNNPMQWDIDEYNSQNVHR